MGCSALNYVLRVLEEYLYRGIKLIIDILLLNWMPIGLAYKSMTTSNKKFFSILITGASSGIGAGLAKHYAKDGVHLFLTARREQKLKDVQKICEEQGAKVTIFKADVCDKNRMEEVIKLADAEKPLDLVIANAGTSGRDQDKTTCVNCNGVINTVWPAYMTLKTRKHGQICINSSITGHFGGWPQEFTYAASKAFALHYGHGLRARAAKHNVGISVVCPGFVTTDIVADNLSRNPFLKYISIDAKRCAEYISYACERNLATSVFPRYYDLYIYYWQTNWNLDNFVC